MPMRLHLQLFNPIFTVNSQWKSQPAASKLFSSNSRSIRSTDFNLYDVMSLLQSCRNVESLNQIHAHIIISGLHSDIFFDSKLINMYGMFGNLEYARQVFDKIPRPDTFAWNSIIRGYTRICHFEEALSLYHEMQLKGMQSDKFSFPFALKACGGLSALQDGKAIHSHIVRSGLGFNDVCVSASLLDMYTKCGKLEDARKVFDKMPQRDVVSWTAIIAGYAQNGCLDEALMLLHEMEMGKQGMDSVVLMNVVSACARLGSLRPGTLIHGYVCKSGFELNVSLMNSFIDMYGNCGKIEFACKVFAEMSERDVISWSSMIAGYVRNGDANGALNSFNLMLLTDIKTNFITMVSVLSGCALLQCLHVGEGIHGYLIKSGFEGNTSVETGLLDMYMKCGNVENAWKMFGLQSRKDVVSWSVMIAGCAHNRYSSAALALFSQMQLAKVRPDSTTIVSVLQACSQLGAIQQGRRLHNSIIRNRIEGNPIIETALIDMYAKCGSIEVARHVFDRTSRTDGFLWSAMIAGYGMHGHVNDALAIFSQMQNTNIQPNHITFLSVLSACSHAGLVDEGCHYFNCMREDYCIIPKAEHYACMVDLLGRAGRLNEAECLIQSMPIEPHVNVWGALLGACRIHLDVALAERVTKHLFYLSPSNAGYYVLLSNIYAAAGRWYDAAKVRTMMKERGLTSTPGCSVIEVNRKVHAFSAEDITPLG